MSASLQLLVSIPTISLAKLLLSFQDCLNFFMCKHNYKRLFCLIFTKGSELYFVFFTWGNQRNSLQNERFCAAFFRQGKRITSYNSPD